jgi:branched-chain amino acid transport system substrate-binding protein
VDGGLITCGGIVRTRRNPWAAALVVCLAAAACGNSSGSGGGSSGGSDQSAGSDGDVDAVDAPGVTDTEIRVGGVASVTNPLDGKFGDAFDGVDAYFQMVNEEGGIHGRELTLVARHDDQVANNDAAVQALLTQDDVFAVLPVASLLFTGADELVEAGMPTFGWTLNPEWQGTPDDPRENLFGQAGSFLCFGCPGPLTPYVAGQMDASRIGLLAYNVPQSADCATGIERSFERYQEPGSAVVAFSDKSLTYGVTDLSVQVSRMKDEGVDLVMTCMDLQGVVTLAREMKRQSLDAVQYLVNAYDHEVLAEFGDLFQGSYVLTFFAPFEVEDPPDGLETYLEWMDRTGTEPTENSMNGWLNAALFVEGLREAGPNFSQEKVVDAINEMTDWDADGLLGGVDWTRAHTKQPPRCIALSRIEGEEFVPVPGEPGKPFVCLDEDSEGIPEGTPSA